MTIPSRCQTRWARQTQKPRSGAKGASGAGSGTCVKVSSGEAKGACQAQANRVGWVWRSLHAVLCESSAKYVSLGFPSYYLDDMWGDQAQINTENWESALQLLIFPISWEEHSTPLRGGTRVLTRHGKKWNCG
jgi:hypothetical protein